MAAPKNIVYFDLETQKSFQQVGGRKPGREAALKMSIGVTHSTRDNEYRIYTEAEVDDLITELTRADVVVGFNHVEFDYAVLSGYTIVDLKAQVPSLDMMLETQKVIGNRIGLDAFATATLGVGKTADGMEALKWWQEGRVVEVAEYCCYDVKVTRLIHEFGARHGKLFYKDKNSGRLKSVDVPWKGMLG